MKKTILAIAIAAVSLPATANLIVNGGFEDGVAYPGGPHWGGGVPGPWFITGGSPDTHDKTGFDSWDDDTGIFFDGVFQDMPTPFGNRFVGIAIGAGGGVFGGEAFGQDVSGLTVGQTYTLSAWMQTYDRGRGVGVGGPFNGLGEVYVYLDSDLVGILGANTAGGVWEARSFSFLATATSGTLSFWAMPDPVTGAGAFVGLDEIALVPEPATMLALGAGLVALAQRRRRA